MIRYVQQRQQQCNTVYIIVLKFINIPKLLKIEIHDYMMSRGRLQQDVNKYVYIFYVHSLLEITYTKNGRYQETEFCDGVGKKICELSCEPRRKIDFVRTTIC